MRRVQTFDRRCIKYEKGVDLWVECQVSEKWRIKSSNSDNTTTYRCRIDGRMLILGETHDRICRALGFVHYGNPDSGCGCQLILHWRATRKIGRRNTQSAGEFEPWLLRSTRGPRPPDRSFSTRSKDIRTPSTRPFWSQRKMEWSQSARTGEFSPPTSKANGSITSPRLTGAVYLLVT